jgi:hypothetical protein
MRKAITLAIVGAILAAPVAVAQTATIRGVVRDSTNRPMANADVVLIPANRRTRTDSTGRFSFGALDNGSYTVRARRVGYAPAEWTVDLSKSGVTEIQLTLGARLALLDTVYVNTGRPCDPRRYDGFMCRRATAKGVFVDYTDIDTMDVYYSADLLRDVGGFHSVVRPTRDGPTRVAASRACTIVLLNGALTTWSSIPDEPYKIIGIEIYKSPKDIPAEYRRHTWGRENCWLVAYWSYDFAMKTIRKMALP